MKPAFLGDERARSVQLPAAARAVVHTRGSTQRELASIAQTSSPRGRKDHGLDWSSRLMLCIVDTPERKTRIEEFTIILKDAAGDVWPRVCTGCLQPGRNQLLAQWLMFEQVTDGNGQSLTIASRCQ